MSFSSCSFAFQEINNTVYFPRVVQGHGSCSSAPSPQFTQYNSAQITGTGGQALAFCSSNLGAGLPSDGCDGQQCVVTGSLSTPSLSLTGKNTFPNWNSTKNIECSTTQSTSINTLNRVNLTNGCELTFLPKNNGYRIKSFQLNQNSKAILTSGDYWFESANFAQNSQLVIDGDVRIFISGNTGISGSQLNATSTGNLTIVAYNRISLNNGSIVNGYIYAADQLTLNNNSVLNGRVTARQLTMSGSSRINQFEQQGYTCFSDDFNRSSLGQNWVPFASSGNFEPRIVDSRLRLTEAAQNQATASTFQRIFPAANNRVEVEFDYFAYGGNGADGVAIVFSDASVTPQVGAFGGPLGYGYKVNEQKPGFAGGWLGIGLDEYGNYSIEGGGNGPGRRKQSVALRGSGSDYSGYNYLAGTCNNGTINTNGDCLSPDIDDNDGNPLHRYRIVIDSTQSASSFVTVSRRIGNGSWVDLIDSIDVLSLPGQNAVPDDLLLSITGSTGSLTNNHEIDNFQVCALDSRPVGPQINHFRMTLPQQALTCNSADVSVMACANSDCSTTFTDPVKAYLTPHSLPSATGGWVNGSTLSLNSGIGLTKLRRNEAGAVNVGVWGSNPTAVAYNNTLCSYDGSNFSAANCVVNFVDSGFIVTVPNAYANQTVQGTIKAVRKDDDSQQCVPGFQNVQKPVSFWSNYLSPNGGQGFSALSVGVNSVTVGQSSNTATPVMLNFNQNGEASINVSYREAGSLALHARFNGSGDEQDLQLTGETSFIRVPRALVLSANHTYNPAHPDGKCPAADINCDVFARADENFDLNIKAVGAAPMEDNDFTNNLGVTNYQQANIELLHTLIEPSTGVPGNLGKAEYSHKMGSLTTVPQKVSEVGVFDFSLNAPTTYLGLDLANESENENLPIAVVSTGPIGRFIPAYFDVSPMTVALEAACSAGAQPFTYLGQSFGYASNSPLGLYLQPKSGGGTDTLNYLIGDWWRYDNLWTDRSYSDAVNNLPIVFTNQLDEPVTRQAASTSGVILNGEQLSYQKPIEPIVPFNADFNLHLSINDLQDSDGVCYRASYSTECLDYTFNNIDQAMPLYWGRVVVEDVAGVENKQLKQKIASEYYTTSGFVTNTHDSCTQLPALTSSSFSSDNFSVNQAGSLPTVVVTYENQTNGPLLLDKGLSALDYSAPGLGNRGVIKALLDLETHGLPWLRTYHQQSLSWQKSAVGLAQFGFYSGSNRVIWWRESN
ncbi:DUF6701 domain-containing protein [Vibrio navarrensis]